jgi:Pyocin activator protein PrtN
MATKIKTTYEILLEKHGNRYVPIIEIGEYFGVHDEKKLRVQAMSNKLSGIRAFKMRDSRKAPLLVDLENVADVLDRVAKLARS